MNHFDPNLFRFLFKAGSFEWLNKQQFATLTFMHLNCLNVILRKLKIEEIKKHDCFRLTQVSNLVTTKSLFQMKETLQMDFFCLQIMLLQGLRLKAFPKTFCRPKFVKMRNANNSRN